MVEDHKKIFVAGPMFSRADQDGQRALDGVLQAAGYKTYLAQRDGLEMTKLINTMLNPSLQSEELYLASLMVQRIGWCLEVFEIVGCGEDPGCDALVLNMNGRVPDEGAVMEASIAYAAGKPVVNYKDSSITMWGLFDNPMVASLDEVWAPVRHLDQLPTAVDEALAAAGNRPAYRYAAPPALAEAACLGQFIAQNRDALTEKLLAAAANIKQALVKLAPYLGTLGELPSIRAFLDAVLQDSAPPTSLPGVSPPRTHAQRRWPAWPPPEAPVAPGGGSATKTPGA
jgi:nucleoside 2-deoxyribosyltransferase